jgi:hypothetical protein
VIGGFMAKFLRFESSIYIERIEKESLRGAKATWQSVGQVEQIDYQFPIRFSLFFGGQRKVSKRKAAQNLPFGSPHSAIA